MKCLLSSLKKCLHKLIEPLSELVKSPFLEGVSPGLLKLSKIYQLFKRSDKKGVGRVL